MTHTIQIETSLGEIRQYGFHLGTDRETALVHGRNVAQAKIVKGARTVTLKDGDTTVAIWDHRDFETLLALNEVRREITRINEAAGQTVFNPAATAALDAEITKALTA